MTHSILQDDDSTFTSESAPSILNNLKNQVQNKQVDRDEQIDKLQTEIRILRRQMPRIRDLEGKDITLEFVLLGEEYDKKRLEAEYLQAELEKCKKYFAETNKKHSNTVKEYDQKLQSLRQEFENSLLLDGEENAKAAIEQAQNIVAAEYQSRINTLTDELEALQIVNRTAEEYEKRNHALIAEIEALRAENKQYADENLDLAQQKEIDDENEKRFDEMQAYYLNELKKQDDIITNLKNHVTSGVSEKLDDRNLFSRELIIERLKRDLQLLDSEWQNNNILREEIEKIVIAADESHDTVSQLHDRLANERSKIRVDSNSSSSSDGIQNSTGREVHGALSNLQKLLKPLVFHLKKLPHYLEGVSGIPESSEFHELLRQITNITFDLDATVNDVTAGIEEFERTMNRTPSPNVFGPPPTIAERATAEQLLNEVRSLRAKLNEEIALKRKAQDDLHEAKFNIDRLTIRVQEVTDEKISLQAELQDFESDFNKIKELYDNANQSNNDVPKLKQTLIDARNSLKAKSQELRETKIELESAQKQLTKFEELYNKLEAEQEQLNELLNQRIDDIDMLTEECERLKQDLENVNRNTSHRIVVKNNVEEQQKLSKSIDSLKKDNAYLLNQNKDLQDRFSENERKLSVHKNYLGAVCGKLCKNDPKMIECPPILDTLVHQYLMDRLDSSGPEVIEKFEYAYNKLEKIKNFEENGDTDEHSIASNQPIANSMANTLAKISSELQRCRNDSNEIISEIKKVMENKRSLDLEWLLKKNRQLRNVLHLALKFFEAKKERIEDGASLPDIIEELGKIHNVLDDAKIASRVLRPDEIVAKGKSYR